MAVPVRQEIAHIPFDGTSLGGRVDEHFTCDSTSGEKERCGPRGGYRGLLAIQFPSKVADGFGEAAANKSRFPHQFLKDDTHARLL